MLTGIYTIDPKVYDQMIDFNTKTGRNMLVFGQAGIGKTEIPIAYAEKHKIPYVYWNLSTQEAPDLVGLPMIDPDSKRVVYAPPTYMPVLDLTPEPVIVIIDELDKAKPELQNPLLEVLQFHSVNGRKLNIKSVFATGNLPDEGAFSRPVSHALTNRCRVFKLETNAESWLDWGRFNNIHPLISMFISKNPEYLSGTKSEDPTAYCRTSPRAWTSASKDLNVSLFGETRMTVDEQALCVAGWVGVEPATKFKVWLEYYKEVEPLIDRVLEGQNIEVRSLDQNKLFALTIGSLTNLIRKCESIKEKKERIKRAQSLTKNITKFLVQIPREYRYASLKMSFNPEFIIDNQMTEVDDFMKICREINGILK